MYSYVTRMYPFVLVCYLYVTRMYSYVTVCHSYVPVCIVCYSYVTRMLLLVLEWSISQDRCNKPVSSLVHANRMKHLVDPDDRPIEPPVGEIGHAPWLKERDLPDDSFDNAPTLVVPPTSHDGPVEDQDAILETLIDNKTVYNAEKLLERRALNGQVQYLVKWAGYPLSDATWEPETNILDPRLLANFSQG